MTQISETTALEMIHKIVKNAVESGADAIGDDLPDVPA